MNTQNVISIHDEKSEEKILIIQDSDLKQLFVKLTTTCESFGALHLCDNDNSQPKIIILLIIIIIF